MCTTGGQWTQLRTRTGSMIWSARGKHASGVALKMFHWHYTGNIPVPVKNDKNCVRPCLAPLQQRVHGCETLEMVQVSQKWNNFFPKWCIHCKPVTFGPKWKWIWSPVCELFKQRNKIYFKISFLFDNFNLHTFCKFAMGSSWSGRRAVQPWKYLLNVSSIFIFMLWCLSLSCCFQFSIS